MQFLARLVLTSLAKTDEMENSKKLLNMIESVHYYSQYNNI